MTKLPYAKTVQRTKGLKQLGPLKYMEFMLYFRIWFRPRVLRDVSTVDWSTTIIGQKSSLPVYIVCSLIENSAAELLKSTAVCDRTGQTWTS